MEITGRLAGRGGRKGKLEFTPLLATAFGFMRPPSRGRARTRTMFHMKHLSTSVF